MSSSRVRPHGPRAPATAGSLIAALLLVACGGGGSSSPASAPEPAPAPAPTTTAVPVKVVDGPLRNARVCVDLNDNGLCDTGEPTARTDASGTASLDVPNAEVDKHAVIAIVGTDAVDADFGPVTAAFQLAAPAGRTALVSPLTTLVATQMQAGGLAAADAESLVRQQLGLSGSLFADYTAASDASATSARLVARVAVLTAQQQAAALAAVVGTTDVGGATITQADVDRAVQRAMLAVLPSLGSAASDPAVTSAANPAAALQSIAQDIVANRSDLTADTARGVIGADRLLTQSASAPADAPTATASFRMLRYAGPTTWFYRAMLSNAADATPDPNGLVRYYDLRRGTASDGTVYSWGFQGAYARRGDLFWNGSAWVGCALGQRSEQTVRDATGFTRYVYCGGYERGSSTRASRDLSGTPIDDVVREIRAQPGTDSGYRYADFGPTDLGLLGTARMPSGAMLLYQRSQSTSTAPAYDVTSPVTVAISDVLAQGGDARSGGAPACSAATPSTPVANYLVRPTTLEQMVARAPGKPCRYNAETTATGTSGPRNDWWGQSSLSFGTVSGAATPPPGTGDYYTTTREIRVAFPAAGQVQYYNCILRKVGGTGRNCDEAGSGTYTIEPLGDARVMRLASPAASTAPLTYDRIFVERAGQVWLGYQVRPALYQSVRLNLVAANALLQQLGLPPLEP